MRERLGRASGVRTAAFGERQVAGRQQGKFNQLVFSAQRCVMLAILTPHIGSVKTRLDGPDVDPAWPYPKVMRHIMADAASVFWDAGLLLENAKFEPLPNVPVDAPRRFPSLDAAREYRRTLASRRKALRRTNPRP